MEFKLDTEIQKVKDSEKGLYPPKHKGLFYRVNHSSYFSQSSGTFHKKMSLTPLKRKSCKGCPTCDAIYEEIGEYGVDEILQGEFEHGDMVELVFWSEKYWTDCGYEYDGGLEWRVVDENV